MPTSIILFETTGYLSLLMGLTYEALNWPMLEPLYRKNPMFFVTALLIVFGSQLLLIELIAHKRAWARWIWMSSAFGGTSFSTGAWSVALTPGARVESFLIYGVQMGMVFLLMTPSAYGWFQQRD